MKQSDIIITEVWEFGDSAGPMRDLSGLGLSPYVTAHGFARILNQKRTTSSCAAVQFLTVYQTLFLAFVRCTSMRGSGEGGARHVVGHFCSRVRKISKKPTGFSLSRYPRTFYASCDWLTRSIERALNTHRVRHRGSCQTPTALHTPAPHVQGGSCPYWAFERRRVHDASQCDWESPQSVI